MTKIAIGKTFAEAYGVTFSNLSLLARVALVPVALLLVLNFAVLFFAGPQPKAWIIIAQNILVLVVQVPLLTSWHRFCLLPAAVAQPTMGFAYTQRELRFLAYLVMVWLSLSVALFIAGGVGAQPSPALAFFVLILLFVLVLLWARLCLVFPAAAVGEPVSLAQSWRLTQGNGWRIFWLLVLVSLPFLGATLAVAMIASGIAIAAKDTTLSTIILSTLSIVIAVGFAGVYSATLSALYRALGGYDPRGFTPV